VLPSTTLLAAAVVQGSTPAPLADFLAGQFEPNQALNPVNHASLITLAVELLSLSCHSTHTAKLRASLPLPADPTEARQPSLFRSLRPHHQARVLCAQLPYCDVNKLSMVPGGSAVTFNDIPHQQIQQWQ